MYYIMYLEKYLPVEYLDKNLLEKEIPNLKSIFGVNKFIPDYFELAFYVAISQFPELKDVVIYVNEKSFDLTLQAQPKSNFLFLQKENREYVICVNNDKSKAHGVLFNDLTFDAQVGIMAHELSHIIDYLNQGNLDIVLFGIRFLGVKYRKIIEKDTDKEVIRRRLGWQLYEWADFAMYRSLSPRRHKYYKLGYYLSPEDIIEEIRTYPKLYQPSKNKPN